MPHLQEKDLDGAKVHGHHSLSTSHDLPIKEAKEGFLKGTEGLPTMMMTSSQIQNSPVKVESFGSTEQPRRSVSEDAACTPQAHSTKTGVITPSPYGSSIHRGMIGGPIITIFGNKKLVPSPIRVKRRVSNSEDDHPEDSDPSMSQPTNVRYSDSDDTSQKPFLSHQVNDAGEKDESLPKKRLLSQLETNACLSSKKHKDERAHSPENMLDSASSVGDDGKSTPTPKKKKPIISPASSGEKGEDDESAGPMPRGMAYHPYGPRGYPGPPPPGYPRHHPGYLVPPPGFGPPPPYPGSYPMYGAYPPHPGHYMGGPPGPHAPYYPPYPPHPHHHHPGMAPYARPPMPPGKYPPPSPYPGSAHSPLPNKSNHLSSEASKAGRPGPTEHAIKSVAEWQRAAISTGKPPSANRCVPLKEPIPSKYWGNAEKTKDAILPDFHRLVNFPDYLAKSRTSPSDANESGKKNCVMCGKLRVCSASSLVGRERAGTAATAAAKPEETKSSEASTADDDDDGTAHIIPRQNKGLCTGCDVTVWVVIQDGLEIKWCKGCKNFRPWAAFGDKGSATKCVRCRERQREKYAMQKDEIRQRRFKRSPSSSSNDEKSATAGSDDDNHIAAARGLRTLMNAANV